MSKAQWMMQIPTWEVITGPSPIDWCEENYKQSNHIAEVNNTITNAAYCIAAVLLLQKTKVSLSSAEGRVFLFYAFALFMTGVTSGIFHASLLWWSQKADEIFENWTVLALYHNTFSSISTKDI